MPHAESRLAGLHESPARRHAEQGRQAGNAGLSPAEAARFQWRGFRRLKVIASTAESEDVRSFEMADVERLRSARRGAGTAHRHKAASGDRLRPSPAFTSVRSAKGRELPNSGEARGRHWQHVHQRARASRRHAGGQRSRGTFRSRPARHPWFSERRDRGYASAFHALHDSDERRSSPREVWWIHSARDKAHHSFAEPARSLVAAPSAAIAASVYSRPGADNAPGVDYDFKGHLSLPLLQQIRVPKNADFYVCGPPRYLEEVEASLKAWGTEHLASHTLKSFAPGRATALAA